MRVGSVLIAGGLVHRIAGLQLPKVSRDASQYAIKRFKAETWPFVPISLEELVLASGNVSAISSKVEGRGLSKPELVLASGNVSVQSSTVEARGISEPDPILPNGALTELGSPTAKFREPTEDLILAGIPTLFPNFLAHLNFLNDKNGISPTVPTSGPVVAVLDDVDDFVSALDEFGLPPGVAHSIVYNMEPQLKRSYDGLEVSRRVAASVAVVAPYLQPLGLLGLALQQVTPELQKSPIMLSFFGPFITNSLHLLSFTLLYNSMLIGLPIQISAQIATGFLQGSQMWLQAMVPFPLRPENRADPRS